MKLDICYWLNFEERGGTGSVSLLPQHRDRGDDAQRPAFGCVLAQTASSATTSARTTTWSSASAATTSRWRRCSRPSSTSSSLCCTPQWCVGHCSVACPPNLHVDCGLWCGLPGCVAGTLCGWPPGMGYFVDLFANRVQNYIINMLAPAAARGRGVHDLFSRRRRPRSWADGFLCCMEYNCAPSRLQSAIRTVFNLATRRIRIPGTEVVAMPLFEVSTARAPTTTCRGWSRAGRAQDRSGAIDAILDARTMAPRRCCCDRPAGRRAAMRAVG